MSDLDRKKVDAANSLYLKAAKFILEIHGTGIFWSIENPTNSWLWQLECMAPILKLGYFAHFEACAYNSGRNKKSSFLASHSEISMLTAWCDGSHSHLPWGIDPETGKFNTAKEAEYTKEL